MGFHEGYLDAYFNCGRYTVFEALVERALKNLENQAMVLNFIDGLENDVNSRIRGGLSSAKQQIKREINTRAGY